MGTETADEILKAMEAGGVDKAIIFSPYPSGQGEDPNPVWFMQYSSLGVNDAQQRKVIKFISKLQAEAPDKIVAFAWIEPRLKNAIQNLEEAVTKYECKGIKLIPDHYYPCDQKFFPFYEKVQELKVPIIFHSGILQANKDSSRFCQPVFYEVLLNFPRIKFALAHISWPWTDECIAVYGRFISRLNLKDKEKVDKMQMYIDLTPGTPRFFRKKALETALVMGAENHMMFGTDSHANDFSPDWGGSKRIFEMDRKIIREELRYPEEVMEKICHKNVESFLKR
jgi:predicted TIM-barrel fold metal-dependent hydrolase